MAKAGTNSELVSEEFFHCVVRSGLESSYTSVHMILFNRMPIISLGQKSGEGDV